VVVERGVKLAVVMGAVALLAAQPVIGRGWSGMTVAGTSLFLLFALLGWVDRRAIAVVLASSCFVPPLVWFTLETFNIQFWILWMAALLGAMLPDLLTTGWHVGPRYRVPLIMAALAVVVATPIVVAREIDFNPALLGDNPYAVLSGLPWHAAGWVIHVGATTLIGILWFDWLTGAPDINVDATCVRPLVLSVGVSALVAVYQMFVDVTFLNETVYGAQGRAGGALFDANVAGTLSAMAIGFTCFLADRTPRRPQWLVLVPLFAMAVLASGSRTAAGAALVVSIVSGLTLRHWWGGTAPKPAVLPSEAAGLVAAQVAGSHRSRRMLGIAISSAILIALIAVSGLDTNTVGPLQRFIPMLQSPSGQLPTDLLAELWRRNGYGTASTYLIGEFPWAGIGIGSFHLFGPQLSPVGALPPDNAQNWLRHQLVEMGVLGGVGWVLFAAAFTGFVATSRRAVDRRLAHLRGVVLAFAVVLLFGLPTQEVVAAVTLWTAIALLARSHPDLACRTAISKRALVGVLLVTAAFGAVTWHTAQTRLRVPMRARQIGWPYSYGFYGPEPDGAGGTVRWMARRATALIDAEGPFLRVSVRAPLPNVERDPVELKIWFENHLVLRTRVSSGEPVVTTVPVPKSVQHALLDIHVSRTVRPRDVDGTPDDRDLGALVAWSFANKP